MAIKIKHISLSLNKTKILISYVKQTKARHAKTRHCKPAPNNCNHGLA